MPLLGRPGMPAGTNPPCRAKPGGFEASENTPEGLTKLLSLLPWPIVTGPQATFTLGGAVISPVDWLIGASSPVPETTPLLTVIVRLPVVPVQGASGLPGTGEVWTWPE